MRRRLTVAPTVGCYAGNSLVAESGIFVKAEALNAFQSRTVRRQPAGFPPTCQDCRHTGDLTARSGVAVQMATAGAPLLIHQRLHAVRYRFACPGNSANLQETRTAEDSEVRDCRGPRGPLQAP